MAGLVFDTGHPLELDIKKRDEPNVHPAFELARIIAEEGLPIKFAHAASIQRHFHPVVLMAL
jgi:hypothetical protein